MSKEGTKEVETCADRVPRTPAEDAAWKAAVLDSLAGASPLGVYMLPVPSDRVLYVNHRLCENLAHGAPRGGHPPR